MNKDFVTYEQAVQLKELGFNESCFACYIKGYPKSLSFGSADKEDASKLILAPTYSQAFRWFRENYKLHSYIHSDYSWNISGGIWDLNGYKGSRYDWDSDTYITYEAAELDCLNKLIEIIDAKIKNRG